MQLRRILALCGVLTLLCLAGAGSALAAGTIVSVRVEGVKRTLLAAKTVTAPSSGSITKGGTPSGSCPSSSAAGALDVATRHRWAGEYSSGLGIEVTQILGETHTYSAHGYYWSIFVDDHYATAGICDLHLRRGERLLFAPYPGKGSTFPIVLSVPRRVTAGKSFAVKASYFPGSSNRSKPISGVRFKGLSGSTNRHGVATLTATHSGKLTLVGSAKGYIRTAATTVTVAA